MILKILVTVAALSPGISLAANMQYSTPVGSMSVVVPSGQTRSMALPLSHYSAGVGAVTGTIDSVGSNYIDVSGANWPAGGYSNPANPYYLRITSGNAAGRVMLVSTTANTSTRLFLNNDGVSLSLSGGPVNGDTYELVLADTLGALFGSSMLQGGSDPSTADKVQVWTGADWLVFYYNTVRSRWERNIDVATSPSRDNFILRPDRGLMITRSAATELKFYITGCVQDIAPQYFHARPGVSFLTDGVPAALTLGTLDLQNRVTGWLQGTDGASAITNADLVQVWSGASWLTFYYNSSNGRWQTNTDTGTSPSRNSYVIPAGRPFMIRRLATTSTPTDGLITMPMPYTLP